MTLPMLGFGAMRLPVIDGDLKNIDEQQVAKMVEYSLEKGVTYFDTAWGYHDGNSELVLGRILSNYPREDFLLADKFPGYDLSNMDKVEEIFEKQLEKCQVDYFDFYLVHNVCEMNIDEYLNKEHGIHEYLMKQKEHGRIRHLGFSAHGGYEVMERFLEAYGKDMEFCQLQINWIDWTFQKADKKVELLKKYDIPVWVMEPLRGGKLASLPEADEAALKTLRPDESIAAWSFRYLQGLPGMTVVLAGMSNLEQTKENIATFEESKPLHDVEMAALNGIADSMVNAVGIPCTACNYCIEYCPQGLDIPKLLELYNQRCLTGDGDFISSMAVALLPDDEKPSACEDCGSCEAVCPQQLKIGSAMADFSEKLG